MAIIVKEFKKVKPKDVILISGMPGVGSVGKISIDFLIDTLDADKLYELYSYHMPNCAFVDENSIFSLPKVEIFHKKVKNKNIVLITGDTQPLDEVGSYALCEEIINLFDKSGIKEIITLGGVPLEEIPKTPKIYCCGNSNKVIDRYSGNGVNKGGATLVGPILGMSGVLVGMGKEFGIDGAILLAETFAHPTYLGLKGARSLIKILDSKLKLNIDIKDLDKEIKYVEKEVKEKLDRLLFMEEKAMKKTETSYIG